MYAMLACMEPLMKLLHVEYPLVKSSTELSRKFLNVGINVVTINALAQAFVGRDRLTNQRCRLVLASYGMSTDVMLLLSTRLNDSIDCIPRHSADPLDEAADRAFAISGEVWPSRNPRSGSARGVGTPDTAAAQSA